MNSPYILADCHRAVGIHCGCLRELGLAYRCRQCQSRQRNAIPIENMAYMAANL